MNSLTEWQKDVVARIAELSNSELLEETLSLARLDGLADGDDWDGGFTDSGRWVYGRFRQELESRLSDWLTKPASGEKCPPLADQPRWYP